MSDQSEQSEETTEVVPDRVEGDENPVQDGRYDSQTVVEEVAEGEMPAGVVTNEQPAEQPSEPQAEAPPQA